ncbi:MAG: hypothetical protein QM770_10940 [Tepidisphaeraceae bacterium]
MAVLAKPQNDRLTKKVPAPGRKMGKQEARDYVFKTYAQTMALLAKN